jgi:hypothetical protein
MVSAGVLCAQSLAHVKRNRAGRHGNFSEQEIHETMCHDDCLISDSLRGEAMNTSGCKCLELSTSPDDPLIKNSGDWCRESSGHKLCEALGICGQWQCSMNDFHCKRMEYNTIDVPLKGYGNECNHATSAVPHLSIFTLVFTICALLAGR